MHNTIDKHTNRETGKICEEVSVDLTVRKEINTYPQLITNRSFHFATQIRSKSLFQANTKRKFKSKLKRKNHFRRTLID